MNEYKKYLWFEGKSSVGQQATACSQIQLAFYFCKQCFIATSPTLIVCGFFHAQQQRPVWPREPKTLTTWLFPEKVE